MDSQWGDYRLLEKLGEGAAGEVHLATPLKDKPFAHPNDLVAIKIYKEEVLKQPGQTERMKREFDVGSQISHPNVVRMYEYSQGQKGQRPYLVMEYVDGITLSEWGAHFHPISDRLLVHVLFQLVKAMAQLHDSGITHRDIKPQNIMMSSTFKAKIMDLGVVEIKTEEGITPADKFLGTIRNASPELLQGSPHDYRTDLYSLGTVLYFLLHGEEVFSEETQFVRLISLVKEKHPDLDPSLRGHSDVRSQIADLCNKLLEKDQSLRPDCAKSVIQELSKIEDRVAKVSDEPIHGYIATALTGLEQDTKDAIDFAASKIAEVCKEYEIYVYQPRKVTDPLMNKDVEAAVVYRLDRKRVVSADILFLLANKPSFGVGQEIEIAGALGKPTILISREGTRISRMVTGGFANIIDEISYRSPEDLERKLRKAVSKNIAKIREWKNSERRCEFGNITDALVSSRQENGFSLEDASSRIGISPNLLRSIEDHSLQYHNVGLRTLQRICHVYVTFP